MPNLQRVNIICLVVTIIFFGVFSVHADIPQNPVPAELKSILRSGHPRIFFNADTFHAVKSRALNEDADIYNAMKARVDKLGATELDSADYGMQASETAFVWLVTEDDAYLNLAKDLLNISINFYHECYAQQKPVNWYAYSRICGWAAYDWIFNPAFRC